MTDYKLVPVDAVRRAARILGSQGFDVWDQLASELDGILAAPAVQGEPVGWHTEDHLDDKSATTYSAEVAQRWRDKGWPVWPLYATPQPAEHQPSEWPRLDRPAKVGAGRFGKGVSSRLVIEAAQRQYEYDVTPEKEADRIARLDGFRKAILQPAPDVAGLVAIAREIVDLHAKRKVVLTVHVEALEDALSAHRKQGGEA